MSDRGKPGVAVDGDRYVISSVSTVEGDGSCRSTPAENGCDSQAPAPAAPRPIPTIHIELSSEPTYEPEKLRRVDRPLLRTPKVGGAGGSNMLLLIQPDNSIVFGSPKVVIIIYCT